MSDLCEAARSGDLAKVRKLIGCGTVSRATSNRALELAAEYGHQEIVSALLEAGADARTIEGYTLGIVIEYGFERVLNELIAAGADVHASDGWPLRAAVAHGRENMLRKLLAAGACARTGGLSDLRLACELSANAGALSIMLESAQPRLNGSELAKLRRVAKRAGNTAAVETLNAYAVGLKLLGRANSVQAEHEAESECNQAGGLRL